MWRASLCTWNSATAANFNTSGKWSGGGCSIPGAFDTAVFDGTGTGNCIITSDPGLANININSGYTGAVIQQAGIPLTVTSNLTQAAGTFTGGDSPIKIAGSLNLSGGTFTSTSGRLEIAGAFNKTGGTFTHSSGLVLLNGTSSQAFASNGATFYDLVVNDGLVGYWKLDEASGTALADGSGIGNTGTLVNGPTWTTASANLPTLTFNDPAAVSFDGVNDYATLGVTNMPALNGAKTVSMWVYYAAVPSAQQEMFSLLAAANGLEIGFYDTGGTRTIRAWNRDGSSLVTATSTPSSGWHHVCYTLSGSTSSLYVDGGTPATSSTSVQTGAVTAAYLGTLATASEYFAGRIDDVRVYNRALSASEVAALAAGYQPGSGLATQTLSGAPTVAHDLVIASGTLAAGANNLTVGGSWWNYGGMFTGTGTVTFNGSASGNFIRSAGQSFTGLTIAGAGTWTVADRLSVPGATIAVNAGTLDGSSQTVRAGGFSSAGGTLSLGSATVILDGAANQILTAGALGGLRIEDPTENNLVGYWKLDAAQGTSIRDFSGNGNSGTLVNGPAWLLTGLPGLSFDDPAALSFDGTNDYATLGTTNLPALNGNMTISFWVYQTSVPTSSQTAVALKAGSATVQVGFWNGTGPRAWNSGGGIRVSAPSALSTGTWHHVAYTYDGTTSKIYVDGGTPTSGTSTVTTGATTAAYLGTYDGGSELLNGRLDDVRIYNTALTAAQIAALAGKRYSNTGGTATTTLGATTTVGGTFAVDSGSFATGAYDFTVSSGSSVAMLNAGTFTVGSGTSTFAGGLTVQPQTALTLATSGGTVAIGSGKTLTMNGTLTASSTGATIQSAGGGGTSYAFSVGTTATATPTLNVSGLAVKNTDGNGLQVNSHTSATTTFTRFDNVAFSSGTGATLLQIYAPSLNLTSSGCTFDAGAASGSTSYAVKLTGNGTADGETRALFGGSTCAANRTPCASYKQDDDANGDGVGDTPASDAAVVQFVRAGTTDTSGTIEGIPVAAFDWTTFNYYATYVTFHDVDGGTADRVYVRDSSGAARYSWDAPSGEDLVGMPRFDTAGGSHYVYVATTAGKVYRLIDSGGSLAPDASGSWSGANPYDCSCTVTSPLALYLGNLYWGGVTGGNQKVWTLGASSRALAASSPVAVGATIASVTPAFWTSSVDTYTYMFLGMSGHFYKVNVTTQSGTTDNTNPTGSVRGRIVISGGKVLAGDDGGTMWALDPSSFANTSKLWSYHDDTNHAGCTSGTCSIKASAYVDPSAGDVYYGDQDGHVYVLQSNGSIRAGFPFRPGAPSDTFMTAPLYRAGVIAIGTSDGNLYFIDRNTGAGSPGLAQSYRFGTGQKISGVSYDNAAGQYMVSVASDTRKDGRLYYLSSLSDPTPATP